ncbi:hypothetical protein FACS1894102_5680 [Spirochaetia bacterium]|nr:hypothetical protein FACS1894102_5680 [Spirochaetia bacterium]
MVGVQKHLNKHGDNLSNVVQYFEREHKDKFNSVLENIAKKSPSFKKSKPNGLMTIGCY